MANQKVLVVSGPSGSGKTTLIKRLISRYPNNFTLSVSSTTRLARPNEQEGVDYNFVSIKTFEEMNEANQFIEYNKFAGNYYGTSINALNYRPDGKIIIVDVDVVGVQKLKRFALENVDYLYLYIAAESRDMCAKLLKTRGDTNDIAIRLEAEYEKADSYAKTADSYDAKFVNKMDLFDDLQENVVKYLKAQWSF